MQTKNIISLQVVLNFIACIEFVIPDAFRLKGEYGSLYPWRNGTANSEQQSMSTKAVKSLFETIYEFMPYRHATMLTFSHVRI